MIYRQLFTRLLFVLFLTCSASSKADFIIATRSDGTMPTINASIGDTVSFDLFLVETNTASITQQGLLSFGLRGTFSPTILEALSVDIAPQFPFVGGGPNPDLSTPGQVDFFGGAATPPKAHSVQLASVKFKVLGDGTTVIRFGDLDPNFDDFSLGDLTSLDTTLFGAGLNQTYGVTVQITAVPEPGTLALVGGAGAFVVVRCWRASRRRKGTKVV